MAEVHHNPPPGRGVASTRLLHLSVWVSTAVALVLALGLLGDLPASRLSTAGFLVLPLGSGLALLWASRRTDGRERLGWSIIAAGIIVWGIGDIAWVLSFLEGNAQPGSVIQEGLGLSPGVADVLYVIRYPLIGFGILALPVERASGLTRTRILLDAFAGSIAFGSLAWHFYLGDRFGSLSELGPGAVLDMLAPVSDLLLVIAGLALITRSGARGGSVLAPVLVTAAMVASLLANAVYVIQLEAGTYRWGGQLDGMWLVGHSLLFAAALQLREGLRMSEERPVERGAPMWAVVMPYVSVVGLMAVMFLGAVDWSFINAAIALVATLVFLRQAVSIRENRVLVEQRRDELISSISHELRTPMTSVSGLAEVLHEAMDELSPEEIEDLVAIIDRQAQHVNRIVDDLVELARGKLRFADLRLEPVDVSKVSSECISMAEERAGAGVDVRLDVPGSLWVRADHDRFTQVLLNLLTNAQRYGFGQVLVEAERRGEEVVLRVHDNGPGIPRRFEDAIWERFERGPNRYNSSIPGSGIGLSIARGLVEAQGGRIDLRRSRRLGGACFVVRLPLAAAPLLAVD